jgi:hypothetical protein
MALLNRIGSTRIGNVTEQRVAREARDAERR